MCLSPLSIWKAKHDIWLMSEDQGGASTDDRKPWPSCANCGKPAFVYLNEFPVCIDCKYKVDQSQWMQFAQNAAMLNYLERQMTDIVGMPHLANEIAIPKPPVPPINYHHQSVSVSDSTVGAINLGNVHDIQVNLQALTQKGSPDIVQPLQQLTDAILNAQDANEAEKNELLEQVASLTALANAKPEERKTGVVKALLGAIKDGATTITSAAAAWASVEPILKGHFGL